MSDRKNLLRDAYGACRRHAEDRQKAEGYAIDLQMERAELQYDLADALGMIAKCDDVPSFEAMIARIRELRLTLRQRDERQSSRDRTAGRTEERTDRERLDWLEGAGPFRMLRMSDGGHAIHRLGARGDYESPNLRAAIDEVMDREGRGDGA